MASPPITELTTRARDIFRLVVEDFLDSGQPVGSKTLAANAAVNLSPASIRSVLKDLEQLGLLAAPHTSAGRMPTDLGPAPVRGWHDAGGRTDRAGARGDRAAAERTWPDRAGAGENQRAFCPAFPMRRAW